MIWMYMFVIVNFFFFSSRRRHTRSYGDWSSDVCSSDLTRRKILQLLIDSGALVKVYGEMFFHKSALEELVKKLRAHAQQKTDRTIDVGAFKDLAGISRKYAIPLLEDLDRQRVTRRDGERRVIL